MIGGTNGGAGGLNLRVVGSNTQPTHPVENMIWLNTDTAIPHWYFQNEAPENPATGDVYITETTTATHVLQLLRNNGLKLYFGTARQYNGSSWDIVGGKIYYSDAWHNLQTFVYDGTIGNAENNFNHSVGGYPWRTSSGGYVTSCTISTSADHFTCYMQSGNASGAMWYTHDKIDFSAVNQVKITYTGSGGGNSCRAGVFAGASSGAPSGLVASAAADNSTSKKTITINTSNVSGTYYLGLYVSWNGSYQWNHTYNIYTIELVS